MRPLFSLPFFCAILQLLILFAKATSAIAGTRQRHVGDLCLDFKNYAHFNEWSTPSGCGQQDSNGPFTRSFTAAASYQRGPKAAPLMHQDNLKRVMLFGGITSPGKTESLGDTWLYMPFINAWTRPQLQIQPYARAGHTMSTLCDSNVILFGGMKVEANYLFNDAWLFKGVTETWRKIVSKWGSSPQAVPQCSCLTTAEE